ncbi:MAG: sigma-70 family RNA polymerase sigma factor [Nitrospirae bacterium]|nr:sigma-70 family RNA polymerase sigma factor [Nitrospirota bacterium]
MHEDKDRELVALCRKGDIDAFEILVRNYQKKMFNMAFRITGSMEDASEVVQDAFVSAYRNLKRFEERSQFSTWIYAITVNTARNRLTQARTRSRHETDSLDDPSSAGEDMKKFEPASGEPSALDLLSRKEQQLKVQECLNRLDHDFREVIVLRDVQGFSYDEISAILSIAAGTVKSRIFRARESVKECLKKMLGDW